MATSWRGAARSLRRRARLTARWWSGPRAAWLVEARRHRWVFVTGCNRSGKTTVANLLGQHPDVTVIPNASSHTRALPSSDREGCPHVWTEKLERFRLTECDSRRPAARLAFDWLHHAPVARPVMVVESDLHAVQMRWLQGIFPDARFIGMVRNGYAVAEGLRLKEGYAIERCARHWRRASELMLADARVVRAFHLVRYEDFVQRPREVAVALADFAGVDAAPLLRATELGWRLGNTDTSASRLRDANPELIDALEVADVQAITVTAFDMLQRLEYLVESGARA
jgi:sulfotransferase family protein